MWMSRWENWPFFDVEKTLEEMDRFFDSVNRPLGLRSVPRGTFPAINVYDQDGALTMTAEIPGITAEDLDLSVMQDTVTLKGRRKESDDPEGTRVYRRERIGGEFARTLTLPAAVNPETVNAEYKNGVLTVRMEKAAEARAKKIKIQS